MTPEQDRRHIKPHVLLSIDDLILFMFIEGKGKIEIGDKVKMPCYDPVIQACLGKPTIQIYKGFKHGERKDDPYAILWQFYCTSCNRDRYYGLFKKLMKQESHKYKRDA
ncbi:hypothetical protein HYU06_01565 [Candidatus Woesearchaeota archaeon]|nr:hypothetical protein [Candidatus Woesearchaeota archaeon]